MIEERGGVVLTAAVLDTTDGDAVVAYTEVVLSDPAGTRAIQYDTVVVPAHRGRGLGSAVTRLLRGRLGELHPGVREISTIVADENASMPAVNEALGYRRERPAGIFRMKLQRPCAEARWMSQPVDAPEPVSRRQCWRRRTKSSKDSSSGQVW
ncbi:GNAT family N-acetyltransferase [Streptomyces sp. NPDC057539]|uniref:GNAT family N-acetyltransferase n=1 Tax=Streptomyces sp. NPDC057539 TaxID=3346159 RepID=UPI0036BB82B1